jgi:hypothetical protein
MVIGVMKQSQQQTRGKRLGITALPPALRTGTGLLRIASLKRFGNPIAPACHPTKVTSCTPSSPIIGATEPV